MAATGFGEISEVLRRSTVQVRARDGRSGGAGVIWSADGAIVTNAHVVHEPRPRVELWDGRTFDAAVASRDPRHDLAALRVNQRELPAAAFRDSADVRPGELVIAIGNPLGFVGALSTGVVHVVGPLRGLGRRPWVQAAVRLAPGNSGGPLADAEGRVIGINTMVVHGLGLAVPSNAIARFFERGGPPVMLGVVVRPVRAGLLVLEVARDSPAANASLLPGDILTGVDGRPFESLDDLGEALESARGAIRLRFLRGGVPRARETVARLESPLTEAAA